MRQKFEMWCKKHAHLLVFFGALIVFLTFVVKEGIGEHFRAVADAIDRARDFYSIRTEIRSASDDLKFELGNGGLMAKRMSDAAIYQMGLRKSHEELYGIDSAIAIIRVLSDSLPNDKLREKSFAIFKQDRENAGHEVEATFPFGSHNMKTFEEHPKWIYQPRHPDSPDTGPVATLNNSRPMALASSLFNFKADVDEFSSEVFDQAEIIRQKNERLSRWAWRISATLFTIGWGLGLVGKIYGLDGVGGE
jgi:hypothetical protein